MNATTSIPKERNESPEQKLNQTKEDKSSGLMKMIKRLDTGTFSSIEEQPRVSVYTSGAMGAIRLKGQKNSLISTAFSSNFFLFIISDQLTNFTTNKNKRPGSRVDPRIMHKGNFSPSVRGYFSPSLR